MINVQAYTDWYDGPTEGFGRKNGRRVFFRLEDIETVGEREIRTYALYALAPNVWNQIDERHAAWNECSGNLSFDLPDNHVPTGDIASFTIRYPAEWDPTEGQKKIGICVESDFMLPRARVRKGAKR